MIHFTVPSEVASIRARISELQTDIEAQTKVPLSEAESLKRIDAMVAIHGARVQAPLILGALIHDGAAPALSWPIDHKNRRIEPTAFDLICALNPERMRADLRALVAASAHPRGPTPAERTKRLKRLRDDLVVAEHDEERLITDLQGRGVNVHRRPDCNPSTILE